MGAIIWQKKTTTNTTGGATIMGSFPTPRNGILSIDYEFILLFKKLGTPNRPDREMKEASNMSKEEWKEYFSGHWSFGGTKQDGHVAMFPEELPRRLIKMFAFVGDIVLDPFMGSGTTALAAKHLNRNSIGYEINSDFVSIIKKKLQVNQPDLLMAEYEFIEQGNIDISFAEEIQKLPYIFKDFHTFDKQIDPKKLQFGSKIDKDSGAREEYFSVKEIISPELIRLSNDLTVRLIGIKENKATNGQAIDFLKQKTKNQKVFMKFDETKYDENNNLLCYLYLKNKTFLNAHLLKNGFAKVNKEMDFRYKERFITLGENYVQSK
jgi:site-specific DNA-methyltransferase (adenine-specific)